ncbi:MAG TPA: hypothetical protein VGJ33_11015 [Candidatus Angelobacter sp.]
MVQPKARVQTPDSLLEQRYSGAAPANRSALLNLTADAGAADLPRGYGWTQCNFPGGASTTISTSGCNRPCTEQHEKVHLNDISPCCRNANVEHFFASDQAAKDRVRANWRRWVESIRATLECRAYDVSVPCADHSLVEKKCNRDSMTHDEKECCGEIEVARDDDVAGQRIYSCATTSRSLPPCPFGPSGPQSAGPAPESTSEQQPNEVLARGRRRR